MALLTEASTGNSGFGAAGVGAAIAPCAGCSNGIVCSNTGETAWYAVSFGLLPVVTEGTVTAACSLPPAAFCPADSGWNETDGDVTVASANGARSFDANFA